MNPSDEALQQSRNSDYGNSNSHLTHKISLLDDENYFSIDAGVWHYSCLFHPYSILK
jgi:hypothetical protein